MMLHCPCCHAHFSIDAVIQDEEARRLLGMKADFPPSLFGYLSLFRSEKRALAWDRMARLTGEVLELGQAWGMEQVDTAMAETVEALRGKGKGPLKNHNYLKRVIECRGGVTPPVPKSCVSTNHSAPSKTAGAIGRLEQWKKS